MKIRKNIYRRILEKNCQSIIIGLIIIFSGGCEIESWQDETTIRDYHFDSLKMINVQNDISLFLIQDSLNFIRIIAPGDSHKGIKPEFKGDTVILQNKNSLKIINRYSYQINAEIHFASLDYILHQSGGEITSEDTIKLSSFRLATNGATGNTDILFKGNYINIGLSTGSLDVLIKGETNYLSLWSTSYACFNSLSLKARKVNVRNNSSVHCYVNVTEELTAESGYVGNIYYSGEPSKKTIIEKGKGKVIKLH